MTAKNAFLLLLAVAPAMAAPKAVLRQAGPVDGERGYYIAVVFDPPLDATISQATLYAGSAGTIPVAPGSPDRFGAATFQVAEADQAKLLASFRTLNLAIRFDAGGVVSDALLPVSLEVASRFATIQQDVQCAAGMIVAVGTDFRQPDPDGYAASRRELLREYVASHTPTGRRQYAGQEHAEPVQVQLSRHDGLPTEAWHCVTLPQPRAGTMKTDLKFAANAPPELRRPLVLRVVITSRKNAPASLDSGVIGKRSIEQNLDLGLQFASSVADRRQGDATLRERTNRGTLDLRFAPLLNLLPTPKAEDRLFLFYTPLYVDARVSTGKVTESTLAQNRIAYGSDFEARLYPAQAGSYPTFHRFIGGFKSVSDRDFHQSEYKAIVEYRPVFGPLNKLLSYELPRRIPWEIDPSPSDVNEIPNNRRIGGNFLPLIGLERGHAYRNRFRAASSMPQTSVWRAYFGAAVQLDLTRRVKLAATDQMYRRFESSSDPWHNYFTASLEIPLPAFTVDSAHSVFATYERGGQPPFNTPDVNSFRLGYRIQWQNWFGRWR
ncbi:MAG: hypothetical protein JNL62_07660 [Bryobacterales bacterium]|nr:hypothetical protein [Bryobacterales bacterium]